MGTGQGLGMGWDGIEWDRRGSGLGIGLEWLEPSVDWIGKWDIPGVLTFALMLALHCVEIMERN